MIKSNENKNLLWLLVWIDKSVHWVTVWRLSDPQDRFFYPHQTAMKDSYITTKLCKKSSKNKFFSKLSKKKKKKKWLSAHVSFKVSFCFDSDELY